MAKQLLIESCEFFTQVNKADLKESVKLSQGENNTLIVKNIPCTILDRENQNGRIYSTDLMRASIKQAEPLFKARRTFSQADEHPEGSFVAPSHSSHCVINSYIKENVEMIVEGEKTTKNVLFQDWLIFNTREGKDLRALFEAGSDVPTSIRGLGDMRGKMVIDYEFLGTDCVGNPSSGTSANMVIGESTEFEYTDNKLQETFEVIANSSQTVRTLDQASQLQSGLTNVNYGIVDNTSVKMDQETNPKTGAQTTITTFEADVKNEVGTIEQALDVAKRALTNPTYKVGVVTIEKIDEPEDIKKEGLIGDVNVSTGDIGFLGGAGSVAKEETLEEEMNSNDNELSVDFGDAGEVSKEFDSPQDAKIAAAGIKTGELDPEILFTDAAKEFILTVQGGPNKGQYVTGNNVNWELTPEVALATRFPTQEEADKFRFENDAEFYPYKDDTFSQIYVIEAPSLENEATAQENVYTNPSEPSDVLVQNPITDSSLEEEIKTVKVTISDIDYDFSPDVIAQIDDETLEDLPETLVITLNSVDIPDDNVADFILEKISEQTGFPITNATIDEIEEVNEEPATEGTLSSGNLDIVEEDEKKAEEKPSYFLISKQKETLGELIKEYMEAKHLDAEKLLNRLKNDDIALYIDTKKLGLPDYEDLNDEEGGVINNALNTEAINYIKSGKWNEPAKDEKVEEEGTDAWGTPLSQRPDDEPIGAGSGA